MSKKIVISGYYGFNNTGDEAVLAGILATLNQLGVDADVTILSSSPEQTMQQHPDIKAVHRYRFTDVLKVIRSADMFVSGGGSLVQDVTSAQSAFYYLGVLRLAQMLGCKTMVYAQGVGPLIRQSIKRLTASTFNRAKAITVRDADSKALLDSVGVTTPVQVVSDPAFLVEPDIVAADKILADKGLAGKEFIGVSLRLWPQNISWVEAVRGVSHAAKDLGVELAYIPMQEPEDVYMSNAVNSPQPAVVLNNLKGPAVVKGIISRCSLLVGMRLHSLIFAASEAVPFVPVVYDPKVASFAEQFGVDKHLDVKTMTEQSVYDMVMEAWKNRKENAEHLRDVSAQIRDHAFESGRVLKSLLNDN